jgi:hypothetical protein
VTGVDGLRELRQEIAQALGMVGEDCDPPLTWRDKDFIQAAVLPVVTAWAEQQARERAAEELHDASVFIRQMGKADADVLSYLRHKSAALADDGQPT